MSDRVGIGLIGCGSMMGAHAAGYEALWEADLRGFRIAATCDVNEAAAQAMADRIAGFQGERPAVYTAAEEMLAHEQGLDAVDISTAHRYHHSLAVSAFEAGKHVTIEKPLAMTMRAGKLILDAAEAAGTLLQVAENYRRAPKHRAIKAAIEAGRIGDVRMAFWIDPDERLWHWGWRDDRSTAGGGWALDGGVHFADLLRYHVGEVSEVYAQVRAFLPTRFENPDERSGPIPVDVEDTSLALFKFESGALGQWGLSGAAPGSNFGANVIFGSEGCADLKRGLFLRDDVFVGEDDLVVEFRANASPEELQRLFPNGVTETVATELHEFIQAIRGEATIEVDGMEGYRDLAFAFALYESSAINAPVSIEDICNLVHESYQDDLNRGLCLI